MSIYVPPHRKPTVSEGDDNVHKGEGASSETWQREAWQALGRSITGIINRVSGDSVQLSATELFRENIVRGRGLFCRGIMRAQFADPDLTNVFASLASCVNKEFPMIGLLLLKRLVVQWSRLHRRRDWNGLRCVTRFIAWLYIFNVVSVEVIYQIILAHLSTENRCDDDVDQAAALFSETFRAMLQRGAAEFHEHVLTPIRDILAMDDDELRLSPRAQALLEACLREVQQWEQVKHTASVIPPHLLLVDPVEQNCHYDVDLDDAEKNIDTEDRLDRFFFDPEYEAHENAYETARRAILGDDWETELLKQVAAAEEEDEEEVGEEEGENENKAEEIEQERGGQKRALNAPKEFIDERERQIRKGVYLAMRSSVRADEVVHKILKSMQPQTERTVCFMVIEGSCEETTYKRMYAMVAERLCKSNAKFQIFFIEAFRMRYEHAEDLEERQIQYTCNIYSHLLRTNSLPWHKCLSVFDIVESDMSQRLMIQWLLQGLVEAVGMSAVLERFEKDRELCSNTAKLFPISASEEVLERAVNMFEAMGVGALGAGLRARLGEIRREQNVRTVSGGKYCGNYDNHQQYHSRKGNKRLRDDTLEYI